MGRQACVVTHVDCWERIEASALKESEETAPGIAEITDERASHLSLTTLLNVGLDEILRIGLENFVDLIEKIVEFSLQLLSRSRRERLGRRILGSRRSLFALVDAFSHVRFRSSSFVSDRSTTR